MKILMTADAVGGVWTYAMELIGASRHQFVLATMGPLPSAAQRAEVPVNAKLVTSELKLEWMEDPWRDVARAGGWLLDLEDEEQPDVVHLNGYAHGTLPFRAPKLVVGHSCVLSWWRAVHGNDAPPEWNAYRDHVEHGLRGADLVIAPSGWMLGALHEHYRFQTPSKLIYNGRHRARSEMGPGGPGGSERTSILPSAAQVHRHARHDRQRVFSAGRMWDEAKNMAAVAAAAEHIDADVRIAGGGAPLGRLDRDAMQHELAQASIYLFPALYEPFGLSILEAALAGCALVIGDIPSLREVWRDAAVFVPPRDAGVIARTVNEILDNDDFRHELARRAFERARDFTPQRMAAAYDAVYLERGGRAAALPALESGGMAAALQKP